jgi:hypothetical protein
VEISNWKLGRGRGKREGELGIGIGNWEIKKLKDFFSFFLLPLPSSLFPLPSD